MINKQNLWFITLFSIILILSIFYINMNETEIKNMISNDNTEETLLTINEETELLSLKLQDKEETQNTFNELQAIILNNNSTIEEKNNAYEKMKNLNNKKGEEEKLEKLIQEQYNLESFIKMNSNNVTVVISKKNHDYELANSIIRTIQNQYKENKYITVKFN